MNWLIYLAEANAYLVIFYLVYTLLLADDTHYQLSRAYLLLSSLVAFVLPLVQLNFLKPTVYINAYTETAAVPQQTPLWQTLLFYGYILGVCVIFSLFLLKLMQIKRLTQSGLRINKKDHQLVRLEESNTAFSFFNYLFMGAEVADEQLIISHELVHIRQKHSVDIVFTELLKAINWFNPAVYMLQNSIRAVHEYIADEQTAQSTNNTIGYVSFLIGNAYGQGGPVITHSFFNQNLLKKRIIMLDQKRSGKIARLKYLVAFPLCAALLTESTLGFSKSYGVIDIGRQKITVDTIKKGKVEVTKVRLTPPPPKPNVSQVKFPPPAKKSARPVKFPPPVVRSDDKKLPPPPPPTPRASQVKFPLPAKRPARIVKFPPPVVRSTDKKLPPPPPPAPPKKSEEIRIEEPVKTQTPTSNGSDIRIE